MVRLRGTRVLSENKYDLVVCSEVLEHMEDPERALQNVKELCVENGFILLSVPQEPIWRICNMARGKYWKDLGNTPGHIQHWTKSEFCRMVVDNDMKIVSVKTPFPWTMVLAKKG